MAQFRTAYLEAVVPVDVEVVGTVSNPTRKQAICKGDLVKLTPATATVNGYIEKATSLANATHIVALTDMTISDGHVKTDAKNYKPSSLVAATVAAAPTASTNGETKKVGLYPIFDKGDVIVDADGNDLATAGV